MTTRPFTIRDADFRVIPGGMGNAPLLAAIEKPGLERIDLWPQGRRKCTLGFAWADGCTAIGDLPWNAEAAWAWLDQRKLGGLIRHHLGRKA